MTKKDTTTKQPVLVKASANHVHIAPRKMRLVTNMIKGLNAVDAITQLQHTPKKASPIMVKLLESAIANAKNNFSLNPEMLFVKSVSADMGKVMKRYFPRARGSAFVIRRKMSHVNIVLEERLSGKAAKGRLSFLNRDKGAAKVESVDHDEAVAKKPTSDEKVKSQIFKSDEQMKGSKIANKRRLFNRKTGV
jgi:large subunit ribosomal protein L22